MAKKIFTWFKPKSKTDHTSNKAPQINSKTTTSSIQPVIVTPSSLVELPDESFDKTDGGTVHWKTLFSSLRTKTNSMTVGIATCPPRNGHLACHRHAQAEVYHIISGRGVLTVEGCEYEVCAGSVAFIPGNAQHGIRNTQETEDLKWLYCFAVDKFEDIIYTF